MSPAPDTDEMLVRVRQLRTLAEEIEDELMKMRLADIPRYVPPR
ncbi:hypothetical protein [Nonomuraea typhae]|uniref:Uncharacterized protein n=1 Tax=Nonomuraea typhae TaxID=2603600 RepID=A0ABW7YM01_9ACTN